MKVNYRRFLAFVVLFFIGERLLSQSKDSADTRSIEEIKIIIGSRNKARVATDTPVPVDVINVGAQSPVLPQTNLSQILSYSIPSFTSNSTTIADGTDHIDPATLRGLGPDQVLTLLNGKRRHTSALVNLNGSIGRGAVGTDMNAIPSFAIERIEVLRDGASAQYGSDAIAGVINIVLKKSTKNLTAAITGGGFSSRGSNNHKGGWDGEKYQLDLNYGTKIGNKGFINLTGSLIRRADTRRAGAFSGNIYNAYNAVEQRALENGVNIASLYGNINSTSNASQILSYIKQFASNVNYFTVEQQDAIRNAGNINAMQDALRFDVTDQELKYRKRSRYDHNMRVGQSRLFSGQLFMNSEYEISSDIKGYAFGGYSRRNGNAGGYYRQPNQARTSTSIYPNGFLPEIVSAITDVSLASGIKGKLGKVNFDLSNTFGSNTIDYSVENTANASMRYPGKTNFDAGSIGFSQNTVNLDFGTKFSVLRGLNVAFGAEGRFENYKIRSGEKASWASYDVKGNIIQSSTPVSLLPTDFFGNIRPGGAQVFPGFRPSSSTNKNRRSVALYLDSELDITDRWLLSGALRFENYSDFGSTLNYKIAIRYKINDYVNFRAAHSTGFRAPSLQQMYYSSTNTVFRNNFPNGFNAVTFANNTHTAKIFGIPKLKQEQSISYSAGFTSRIPELRLSITLDGYFIRVNDRIVLTDYFKRPAGSYASGSPEQLLQEAFDKANATQANFFANAINTETKGIEGVVSHKLTLGNVQFNSDLALALSKTHRVGAVNGSDILVNAGQINTYFSERSRVYLEEAFPRFKTSLNHTITVNRFTFFLRNVYFGEVTDPETDPTGKVVTQQINGQDVQVNHPIYSGKIVTDLSLAYAFKKNISLTIGANNLFDVYPDRNPPALTSGQQFIYSRNVSQFGMNGRFLFTRLNITL
ncbi:MAG: TonB-dependent receptor [Bergeyella sp.]|nr:TonB-dependent receptor [Bergeyella sp.]